jgi:hypothetical protein
MARTLKLLITPNLLASAPGIAQLLPCPHRPAANLRDSVLGTLCANVTLPYAQLSTSGDVRRGWFFLAGASGQRHARETGGEEQRGQGR